MSDDQEAPETRDPNDRPRGKNGAYVASPDTAERDAAACRLRIGGKSYDEIAKELGFANKGHAFNAVSRNLKSIRREPAEELLKLELARLDEMRVVAREIMLKTHHAHSGGKLIHIADESGKTVPLVDDGPRLAAIDRLVSIANRYAKLTGLDAVVKVQLLTLEDVQAEITRLEAEADAAEREAEGDSGGWFAPTESERRGMAE